LKGVQAVGASAVDIGAVLRPDQRCKSRVVQKMVADTTNQGSEITNGFTDFLLPGRRLLRREQGENIGLIPPG